MKPDRERDEADGEEVEEGEGEEFRAPAEEQAPARWFRPHGPSRRLGIPNPVITQNTHWF